jgi:AMMECR1 domain-containing protein
MKKKIILASAILLYSFYITAASDSCLDRWSEFSHTPEKTRLTEWLRNSAENILAKNKIVNTLEVNLPAHPDCTGLFITIIRKGKVRGCYGAFSHRYTSPAEILLDYIKGALFLDPRHDPLERHELADSEIILTVASNPEPVDDINNVDISNFGLFIECDDSSKTVIVPAEYRTASKVIKLTGNRQCRYQKFRAVTIR